MSTDGGGSRLALTAASLLIAAIPGGSTNAASLPVVQAAPVVARNAAPVQGGPSFFDNFDRFDTRRWYVSDGWTNGAHQGCTWSRDNVVASGGTVKLLLDRRGGGSLPYRCGEFHTNARLGYGTYEVRLRTAAGSGLNTAMFTYAGPPVSPSHDEIDFEFLGRGPGQVQLNYYTAGKGGHETVPSLGFDGSASFNDYAFMWSAEGIKWYINGRLVREEKGAGLPTVPGPMLFSLWNGTKMVDGWLGPFDDSHLPAVAEIDWAGFTRAGERCLFPQSVTCKLP